MLINPLLKLSALPNISHRNFILSTLRFNFERSYIIFGLTRFNSLTIHYNSTVFTRNVEKHKENFWSVRKFCRNYLHKNTCYRRVKYHISIQRTCSQVPKLSMGWFVARLSYKHVLSGLRELRRSVVAHCYGRGALRSGRGDGEARTGSRSLPVNNPYGGSWRGLRAAARSGLDCASAAPAAAARLPRRQPSPCWHNFKYVTPF